MNDQSPPKRVTRARAAAKTDTDVKIATAASKAKVTRTASTTKRKTRADDVHDHDELNEPQPEISQPELPKTSRGRAKKATTVHQDEVPMHEIVEPEAPKITRVRAKKVATHQYDPEPEVEEVNTPIAPAKSTRGRTKKPAIEVPLPGPMRATRGRAKKIEVPEEEEAIVVEEPPRKPTRSRAATISKATAPKKTVKFEEPDKENIVPSSANTKGKAKVAEAETGLKARPIRKPAVPVTRGTRGRVKVESNEQKSSALSPKKPTQVATAKDHSSEDELASNEKTPMKPLMQSPIKAPGNVFGTAKKLDFSTSITVHRAVGQDLGASTICSPARRPPQSPFKESLKASPQRANLGGSLVRSPIRLPFPNSTSAKSVSTADFKASLLLSPARRPQSPTKVSEHGSPSRSRNSNPKISGATPKTSTFKMSHFATPRTLTKSTMRPGEMLPSSAFKNVSTGSPILKSTSSVSGDLLAPSLTFSGRLSSIMPRDVDPALRSPERVIEKTEVHLVPEIGALGEPMAVDVVHETEQEKMDERTTTPPCSPPRNSTGAFALRDTDENPFMESDSEDELASVSPKYSTGPTNLFATSSATPIPFTALTKTPKTTTSQKSKFTDRVNRQAQIGCNAIS